MYNISVCESCGRTIESRFLYCPWCGFSKIAHKKESASTDSASASMDLMFSQYIENKKEARRTQLLQMEAELTKLEEELSVLVLSTEMHK